MREPEKDKIYTEDRDKKFYVSINIILFLFLYIKCSYLGMCFIREKGIQYNFTRIGIYTAAENELRIKILWHRHNKTSYLIRL